MTDQRPRRAQRIQHLRRARSWSQQDSVAALRSVSVDPLPDDVSLLRSWKRWEAGTTTPSGRYRELIAAAFGVEPEPLFAGNGRSSDVVLDPGLLDLIARIDRSDVDQATIDRIGEAADQMCSDYSALPAADLLAEAATWLVRIDGLFDRRHTDRQRRQLSTIHGWLSLLVGSIHLDLTNHREARQVVRHVDRLAAEAGHAEQRAWARELAAWDALSTGRYRDVLTETGAGRDLAPHAPVAAQLAGHEAEALARMGDRRGARRAVEELHRIRERMPTPDRPRHHFQLEPSKFDKVDMRVASLTGRHDEARALANRTLDAAGGRDTASLTRPMAAAKALIAIGVAAAADGEIDAAVTAGHEALDIPRQSVPSLLASTTDLAHALAGHRHEPAVTELMERIAALRR